MREGGVNMNDLYVYIVKDKEYNVPLVDYELYPCRENLMIVHVKKETIDTDSEGFSFRLGKDLQEKYPNTVFIIRNEGVTQIIPADPIRDTIDRIGEIEIYFEKLEEEIETGNFNKEVWKTC